MPNERNEADLFHKAFLLLLAVAISAAFLTTIRGFLLSLLLAAILAGLCQPVHRRLLAALGGRRAAASLLTVLGLLVVLVIPATIFMGVVTAQAIEISNKVSPWVSQQIHKSSEGADLLEQVNLPAPLQPYESQIVSKLGALAGGAGGFLVTALASATRGTVQFFFLLFVTLYAMFFFLMGGRAALDRVLYYIPLRPEEEEQLLERFASVSRATLKGTLVIGIVQGGLAGGAFAVVGIQGAAFWGTLMALLSIVPGLGTALVWVPAVIFLFATGKTFAAVGLMLWCGAIVGTADNVLRPLLVGRDTRMPDLLIFVSTMGGLVVFGAVGILIGPLIAALFLTVWEIYGLVFREYLPDAPPLESGG
ncbi:MAG: AI-2E family transporter [Deltaproteobacteria bacterium]|nr:AI-2E family transporter [Deltaproteobacteria bacterium]